MMQASGQHSCAPNGVVPVWSSEGDKPPAPRNRMREIFTSISVGGASGNRRIYPEADGAD
ncbi:hypothetical protein QUF80_14525 [Desulfococcaceae bacterium HSG8]|nr:hypothetical protein [Desulfococcaceae bacterium HSG8]